MKWVSIQDKLPPLNEEVWVHDKEIGVTIGSYSVIHERSFWADVYGDNDGLSDDRLYEVTHWMSMDRPEPPEQTWTLHKVLGLLMMGMDATKADRVTLAEKE